MQGLAWQARRFLEGVWPDWHRQRGQVVPAVASAGTCGRSSVFLARVLAEAGHAALPIQGWFLAEAPARHGWVRAEGLILDITADQFGAPPVLVCPADDPRYRPGPDTAEPAFQAARARDVAAVWEAWRRFRVAFPFHAYP